MRPARPVGIMPHRRFPTAGESIPPPTTGIWRGAGLLRMSPGKNSYIYIYSCKTCVGGIGFDILIDYCADIQTP